MSSRSRSSRDLVGGLGPLGPELGVEPLRRRHGVVAVLGVADLGQHLLGGRLHRLGQGVEDVGDLVHPVALLAGLGPHVAQRRPEPQRPVAHGDHRGAACPAACRSRSRSAQLVGRLPVAVGDGDQLLGAVQADAHDDQAAQPVLLEADVEVHPVDPARTRSPGRPGDRPMNARCSSCHWVVSRVITDGDSPAARAEELARAPARSHRVDRPCRYSNGSTSDTLGLLRHHGGTIELLNRARSPVSGSTRRSFDPGRSDLDRARRRGDRARPGVPVADHQPPAPLVELDRAARRGTRRPPAPTPPPASAGRPHGRSHPTSTTAPRASTRRSLPSTSAFLPRRRCQRRQLSFDSTRKVRRALERVADPQLQVIPRLRADSGRGHDNGQPLVSGTCGLPRCVPHFVGEGNGIDLASGIDLDDRPSAGQGLEGLRTP